MVVNPASMKPGPAKLSPRPVFGTEKVAVAIGVVVGRVAVGSGVTVWLGSGVIVGVSVGVSVGVGSCFGGSVGVTSIQLAECEQQNDG